MNERESFIHDRLNEEFARSLRWAAFAGAIFFVAFAGIDFIAYRGHAPRFFLYRIVAAACLALTARAAGKTRDHRVHLLLGLFAVWVSAAAIEVMILQTGGQASHYSMPMILLAVCVFAFVPGNMLFHGLAACSLVGFYVLPIIVTEPITEFSDFFINVFFLLSIIIALLALRRLGLSNFRDQASFLYEMRAYADAFSHKREETDADPLMVVRRLGQEIAALRSAGKMLEASEKKYRTLFESAPDAFYISDLAGNFIDGNRIAQEMTGYGREEAIGRNFLSMNLLSLTLVPKALQLLALNALGQATGPDEFELVAKNGSRIPVEISTYPVTVDGKKVVLGIARDITERKKSRERLQSANKRLEHLVVSSPAVIYTCRYGGDWNATFMSENLRDVLGYEARENLESPGFWLERIHPGDRDRILKGLQRLSEKDSHAHEYRFRHKDGSYRWMFDRIRVVRNEEGRPVECVGSWIDISDCKAMELKLQSQYVLLDSIINSPKDLILFSVDRNYCYTSFNAKHSEEMKKVWHADIAIGMNLLDCMRDPVLRGLAKNSFDRALRGEGFSEIQRQPELDIYYEFKWNPIVQNREVIGAAVFVQDITANRQAEEELAGYRKRLEELVAERTVELRNSVVQLQREIDERIKLTEELHRSKMFLNNILNSIQDGICVLDNHRRVMLVNNAVMKWVPEAGQIGFLTHTCGELFHKLGKCDDCVADAAMSAGNKRTMVFPCHDETGKKWFEIHSFPLNADDDKIIGWVEYIRDITEAKIMGERIAQHQEQLRALNYEMAALENREQRRIAQELHDSIPQNLVFCRMRLESIEQRLDVSSPAHGQTGGFKEIYALLDDSITQARSLIFKLAPPVLYELGFEPAMQQLLHQFIRNHPIEFHFENKGRGAPMQGEGAAIVYGMVRELLTNAVKHASATVVILSVSRHNGELVVEVRDNGKGFDQEKVAHRAMAEGGGFGLFSIRERVRHMDGVFTIETGEGVGICATIRVPLLWMHKVEHQQRHVLEDV